MAAVRHHELVVKATEYGQLWKQDVLLVYAEHLLWKIMLWHSIMIVQACLSGPTDEQGTGDMGMCPRENVD